MSTPRSRVLLVDDDADDRALARLVLAHELPEIDVEEIADAPAFARAWGRRSFDLVILERELRWGDGLALLAVIKEDWPEAPVILFTRPGDEELAVRAVRLGADDCLAKRPAGFLRLPAVVRAALEKRRCRRSASAGPLQSLLERAIEDVTTRKQADYENALRAAQLRRSNEELLQFASMAAHELQAPVRTMERYTQLLKEDYAAKLGTGGGELADLVIGAARRMRLLIEDLLALSRLDSRERQVETAAAGVLFEQALENLQEEIQESGAEITHSSLPEIEGEPSLIVQLFHNLIGNAIKFRGDEPPRVEVAARRAPREWVFSVRDNGIGIDAAEVESIFTIFKRLRPEIPGSGVGLALCRKIVERHGGRIWLESEPGRGSTFHFSLPVPRQD
jgi:signal transduction histidine kinase